jgi:hypothetical protein
MTRTKKTATNIDFVPRRVPLRRALQTTRVWALQAWTTGVWAAES